MKASGHSRACISHKTYKIIILVFSGVLNAVFYFLSHLCVVAILTALGYRPSGEEGPAATQTSFLPSPSLVTPFKHCLQTFVLKLLKFLLINFGHLLHPTSTFSNLAVMVSLDFLSSKITMEYTSDF